jgi:hypothetical protein
MVIDAYERKSVTVRRLTGTRTSLRAAQRLRKKRMFHAKA